MKFGELEIYVVSDGIVHVDAGGPFGLVPRALYRKYSEPDGQNRVSMALNSLLIQSKGKNILVDTGLGNKLSPKARQNWGLDRSQGGLLQSLGALKLAADDIDIVINTHLHSDHCGGNTILEDEHIIPVFPNATYLVQRMEWADASHPDERTRGTYLPENFQSLVKNGQMKMLHGDHQVSEGIWCRVAPGHTRGHQIVTFQTTNLSGFFAADMAGMAVNMIKPGWLTAYDVDPLENIATKKIWQRWAGQNSAVIFFQHDPETEFARLKESDGRVGLQVVLEEDLI
jgi:glyoxylase-like metal-dependent hydrolase (beta-lactamase superfamily II)